MKKETIDWGIGLPNPLLYKLDPELLKMPKDVGAVTGLSAVSKITQEIRQRQLEYKETTARAIIERERTTAGHLTESSREYQAAMNEMIDAAFKHMIRKCICCGGPGHEVEH